MGQLPTTESSLVHSLASFLNLSDKIGMPCFHRETWDRPLRKDQIALKHGKLPRYLSTADQLQESWQTLM